MLPGKGNTVMMCNELYSFPYPKGSEKNITIFCPWNRRHHDSRSVGMGYVHGASYLATPAASGPGVRQTTTFSFLCHHIFSSAAKFTLVRTRTSCPDWNGTVSSSILNVFPHSHCSLFYLCLILYHDYTDGAQVFRSLRNLVVAALGDATNLFRTIQFYQCRRIHGKMFTIKALLGLPSPLANHTLHNFHPRTSSRTMTSAASRRPAEHSSFVSLNEGCE